jgi:hypothetical protein
MMDQEKIINICKKLRLHRSKNPKHCVHADVYCVEGDEILIGRGLGEYGGYISFQFDEHGNIESHLVGNYVKDE